MYHHKLVLFPVALVISAFLVAACGVTAATPVANPAGGAQPAATVPTTLAGTATPGASLSSTLPDRVQKVFDAQSKASSYKKTIMVKDGEKHSLVFVAPDRISVALGDPPTHFIIAIADKSYASGDGVTWANLGLSFAQVFQSYSKFALEDQFKDCPSYSLLPDEQLDGKEVGVFACNISAGLKMTYHYDKQNLLILQTNSENNVNQYAVESRFSDYNSPTNKVEAPTNRAEGTPLTN